MLTTDSRTPHIPYLDGARGVAAISVFLYHVAQWGRWGNAKPAHGIELLINGADAVSFFFVLSGFVLSFKYLHTQPAELRLSLKQFLNSRFWRIYPAFWLALLIYAAVEWIHCNATGQHFSYKDVLFEATLIHGITTYMGADWSLILEVGMSAVMPFMMLVIVRSRRWFWAMTVLYFMLPKVHSTFMIHFLLGVGIAWHYRELSTLKSRCPRLYRVRWLVLALAFLLFDSRHFPFFFPSLDRVYSLMLDYLHIQSFILSALASAIFLIYLLNSRRAQAILSLRPVLFLGRISYSVYLLQALWSITWAGPITEWLAPFWSNTNWQAFLGLTLVGGAGLIVSASLSYYLVERPFMAIGKRFYKRYLAKPAAIG